MMVMPSNNYGLVCGYLAGKYPGRIGWLFSPGSYKRIYWFSDYALDNGAYPAWKNGTEWDEDEWWEHLEMFKYEKVAPRWCAIPDVVTEREATIEKWHKYAPMVKKEYGYPLAFVVQDGMTPNDIPTDPAPDVVFVGGSTEFKWRSLSMWADAHPRIHVGRVNTKRLLWLAHPFAESTDGTGWFRGDQKQLQGLVEYLDESTNGRPQTEFDLT